MRRRRAEDTRPPIEVFGVDPGAPSVQQVIVGPGGGGPSRGRMALILLGVVALLGGGLLLSGREDPPAAAPERSTSTSRRTTSTTRRTTTTRPTTTTTTRPVGPVLGAPVTGLLVGYEEGTGWEVLDLATGQVREIEELPENRGYEAVAVRGGIVAPSRGRDIVYFDLRNASLSPRVLGQADGIEQAGDPDHVWLIEHEEPLDPPIPIASTARLVDLQGRVQRVVDIPGAYVSGSFDGDLVIERGGRVFRLDESGPSPLATGSIVAADGRSLVLTTCDDDARCSLVLRRAGLDPVVLQAVPSPDESYIGGLVSSEGRVALIDYQAGSGGLRVYEPDGRLLVDSEVSSFPFYGEPIWLPGAQGFLVSTETDLAWLRLQDGELVTETLEGFDDFARELIWVIPL